MKMRSYGSQRQARVKHARELWDQGWSNNEIATILRVNYATIAKLTQRWPRETKIPIPSCRGVSNAQRNISAEREPELPPSRPTQSVIGSIERIEEYRRRVEAGEELYHPADCTCVVASRLNPPAERMGSPRIVDMQLISGRKKLS